MDRRSFVKASTMGGVAVGMHGVSLETKTHILTLSFDDGFKKSFFKIADIYEKYGLHACFNVIASGHLPSFQAVDQWILPELMGNFDDWNLLKARGHEVMPHSWQHLNLGREPIDKAKDLIMRCLDYFADHLRGYDPSSAVFNFPFNSSTPELEAFTMSKVRAVRTRGDDINPIPQTNTAERLGCSAFGPDNGDAWVDQKINSFLAEPGGWLILNLHGLDDEGWGPISTTFLEKLIPRLHTIDKLEILPAGDVLERTVQ
ncbi:MAG: polysaccharide deacetylase family protein [Saprospiraceae bacterium]|nr:polysaccharide deacetylase family protein [Saprospiraceae bacterium]